MKPSGIAEVVKCGRWRAAPETWDKRSCVDGCSVEATAEYLREHWPRLKRALLDGTYRPEPVRRVAIPKPGGGERELGIPTVVDRLIQQALLQVLQPLIDSQFSDHSYGFRPGRRAHDAILRAQGYVEAGYRIVVDVDLEKFFDRVNHDVLMNRLARRTTDKAVLRLIRRYLDAGVMAQGVVIARHEGTPQGASYARTWHRAGRGGAARLCAGLEGLLPVGTNSERVRRPGRMVATPAAHAALGPLEARTHGLSGTAGMGASPGLAVTVAGHTRSWWRNSAMALNAVLTIAYFDRLGVPRLA